jgi:hypothetical protein
MTPLFPTRSDGATGLYLSVHILVSAFLTFVSLALTYLTAIVSSGIGAKVSGIFLANVKLAFSDNF